MLDCIGNCLLSEWMEVVISNNDRTDREHMSNLEESFENVHFNINHEGYVSGGLLFDVLGRK